jgi:hypothetical protein
MKLVQLGANVEIISGKMVYVKFSLENNLEVAYIYHINKNNKYFLERIKPYPLPIREFDTPNDVIDMIKLDHEQFKNAVHSSNIYSFIQLNKDLHKTMMSLEDLFLYYNVSNQLLKDTQEKIKQIEESILDAAVEEKRIFFDKDPENLKK